MLVAGNVIIGRKVEETSAAAEDDVISLAGSGVDIPSYRVSPVPQGVLPIEKDDDDEDVALLGDLDESHVR